MTRDHRLAQQVALTSTALCHMMLSLHDDDLPHLQILQTLKCTHFSWQRSCNIAARQRPAGEGGAQVIVNRTASHHHTLEAIPIIAG